MKNKAVPNLLRYTFDDDGFVDGLQLVVKFDTTDEEINSYGEPHRSTILKMRELAIRYKREGIRNEDPGEDNPILQFFPDYKSYGRTCFIADGQQSWYGSQRLVAEGKVRDRTDPVILINALKGAAGIDLRYYSWCMATKKQSQIDFMHALEINGFVTRNFPVTKENETESGNVDHLVSQEITTAAVEQECDTFILFFGDKDYRNQIQTLKNSCKRIILIINSSMASKAITSLADHCIEVEHISHHLTPDRPLENQYWWYNFKHNPDKLSFLSEEEKSIMRPLYLEYLKKGGEPSSLDSNKPRLKKKTTTPIDRPKLVKSSVYPSNDEGSYRRTRTRPINR